jgi:MFS family permease
MPAGSFCGALLVSYVADQIGRKKTVILSGLIWVAGSILQCSAVVCTLPSISRELYSAVAQDRGMLITGRVISGISVGIASTTIPLYQSEIAAPSIRGRLVSVQQWSITWGILIQYFIQFGCSYIDGVASFRIPWALQVIPAIVLSIGMIAFPESPRWLIDHHRYSF